MPFLNAKSCRTWDFYDFQGEWFWANIFFCQVWVVFIHLTPVRRLVKPGFGGCPVLSWIMLLSSQDNASCFTRIRSLWNNPYMSRYEFSLLYENYSTRFLVHYSHYSSFSFCFLMSKVCLYALFWNHFRGSLGRIETTDLGRSYFMNVLRVGSWRDSKNGWFHSPQKNGVGLAYNVPKK